MAVSLGIAATAQKFIPTLFNSPGHFPLSGPVKHLFFPDLQLEITDRNGGSAEIRESRSSTLLSRHFIEINSPMPEGFMDMLETEALAIAQADAQAVVETVQLPMDPIVRIKQLVEQRGLNNVDMAWADRRMARRDIHQEIKAAIQAANLFSN